MEFVKWLIFARPLEAGGARFIPDGYCELQSPSEIISSFIEIDLGHEGLEIWKQKVRAYVRYAVSGNFESQFQRPRFLVLVIANSERRLKAIRRAVAEITNRIFWFTTQELITERGLWSEIWLRPQGEENSMLIQP